MLGTNDHAVVFRTKYFVRSTFFQRRFDFDFCFVHVMHLSRLFDAATAARVELTRAQQSHVNIPYITADQTGPKHMDVMLTRARVDRIIEPLLMKVRRAIVSNSYACLFVRSFVCFFTWKWRDLDYLPNSRFMG